MSRLLFAIIAIFCYSCTSTKFYNKDAREYAQILKHQKLDNNTFKLDQKTLSLLKKNNGCPIEEKIDKKLTKYYHDSWKKRLDPNEYCGSLFDEPLVVNAVSNYKKHFKGGAYSTHKWGYFLKIIKYNTKDDDIMNFLKARIPGRGSDEIKKGFHKEFAIAFQLVYDSDKDGNLDKLATKVVSDAKTRNLYYPTFDLGGKCPPDCFDYKKLYVE